MKQILTLYIALITLTTFSFAQEIGIGEWQDQLPYSKPRHIEEVENLIFSMSSVSLFSYDRDDNSTVRFSKVNGLSDSDFSALAYNAPTKTVVIAYSNGNIDLITETDIINVPDIKRFSTPGNKAINSIMFIDKVAYLSCGFGIVLLNLETVEIEDTYYIGDLGTYVDVNSMAFDGTKLYALAENIIYSADYDNPNLSYYENWTKDEQLNDLNTTLQYITFFENKLLLSVAHSEGNDTIYSSPVETLNWTATEISASNIYSIRHTYNNLVVTLNTVSTVFDENLQEIYTASNPAHTGWTKHYDAITDNEGQVWYCSNYGTIETWNDGLAGKKITLNGPNSSDVFSMASGDESIWVAPGAYTSTYAKSYNNDGVFSKTEETWTNINGSNSDAFDTITDVITCAIHPTDPNRVYAGTWGSGVVQFDNNNVTTVFNATNSSLGEVTGWAGKVMVSGLAFDSNNDLWVANSNTSNLLSRYDNNGTWKAFNLGGSASTLDTRFLAIDKEDQKWILTRAGNVFCFSENVNSSAGGTTRILSQSDGYGDLPGSAIYSILVDRDGEIWFGSDEGIAVIYNPEDVLEDGTDYDAQRILVEWDGYVQYLLQTEKITTMAINGGNEKWIGTAQSGVYKLSADGTEQLQHFTAENSPLFSNNIIGLTIDYNGTVYIGTDNGIISYRDNSTPSDDDSDMTDAYAFPNPVPPGYTGTIGIKGLTEDAFVKITDIAGNLVYSTQANGGQAVWNGYNFNGDRAQSGVYLVFVSNEDGTETTVTKILFLN